jgi:phage/plasmid-associated DNA primase
LRFLAFEDGVYSFESKQLMPYPVEGVFFTYKINRKFPAQVGQAIQDQLVEKVLKPILPDEQQRAYFLHCLARALAGEIYDKKWYICVGERNSGKGVLCELMSYCFQDFVQTINSENLVYSR